MLFREHGIEIAFNQMDVYIKNMQGDEQKVESRPALPPAGTSPSDPARFTGPVTGPVFFCPPPPWKAQIAPNIGKTTDCLHEEPNGLALRRGALCHLGIGHPGPNNIMVMSAGASVGIRKSLPLLMGICVGFTLMLLLVGLGFGQLFTRFPELHLFIKCAGTLYLLYLAWLIARPTDGMADSNGARPFGFFQGCPVPVGQCQGLGGCHRRHRRLHQRGERPL